MKLMVYGVAVAMLGAGVGPVVAQRYHRAPKSSRTSLSSLDKDYIKSAAQSNIEEIEFAPTVMSHAGTSQDRKFGERMKSDHTMANADLKDLAATVGYSLPNSVSDEQRAIMKRLAQFHGPGFDAAYKQEMIRDHTGDIVKARREISLGSNPLVKENAHKNLALLQKHLQMARALPDGGR